MSNQNNSVEQDKNTSGSASRLSKTGTVAEATPRPWRSDIFAVYGANGQPAAHTGACGRSNAERIENAELIVRAVNAHNALVAALTEILNFGVELDDERMNYVVAHVDRDAIKQARAVLSLARGETQK